MGAHWLMEIGVEPDGEIERLVNGDYYLVQSVVMIVMVALNATWAA